MNIFKTIKQTIYSACLYFTAAEFLILLIATSFAEMAPTNGGTAGMFLSLGSTALIFVACFIMSVLNLVWRLEYSTPVKLLLHFIGTLAAYSVIFIIIPRVYTDAAQVIARIAIFAAVYLVIAFIAVIISSIRKNRRTEDFEYESQFGNFFDGK